MFVIVISYRPTARKWTIFCVIAQVMQRLIHITYILKIVSFWTHFCIAHFLSLLSAPDRALTTSLCLEGTLVLTQLVLTSLADILDVFDATKHPECLQGMLSPTASATFSSQSPTHWRHKVIDAVTNHSRRLLQQRTDRCVNDQFTPHSINAKLGCTVPGEDLNAIISKTLFM